MRGLRGVVGEGCEGGAERDEHQQNAGLCAVYVLSDTQLPTSPLSIFSPPCPPLPPPARLTYFGFHASGAFMPDSTYRGVKYGLHVCPSVFLSGVCLV